MIEIPFRKLELEDRETVLRHLAERKLRGCERTFANVYLWARFYNEVWAEIDGTAVFRTGPEGAYSYTYPIGAGDRKAVVELLMADAKEKGYPFRLHAVSQGEMEELESYFPGMLHVEWPRDAEDYVYETEKLIRLAGKKYHGKKNHINQFKAAYPDWSYESISDANVEECFQMALKWRGDNGCEEDPEKNQEMCVALNSLRLFRELGLKGGLLRAEGRVVAFTLGEPVCDDTFVVHIEKAYADVRGAYPLINQQFLENEVSGYQYVNREDDLGEEGLRKAKLSYHPVFMVEKGVVTLKTGAEGEAS
ncbi:MAG: phosphatidylglycerol lysyltransferase domain-containing protein [Eubacteriales bacterium]|nr:phosphatidylglycerol lysyltransferase domain-containing protein [Eubacteriales bacterium]